MLRYNRTSRAPRCRPVQNRERNVTDPVLYAVRDGIAVLTVENPPVNALGQGVRAGLIAGLDKADADPAVSAAVIIGDGQRSEEHTSELQSLMRNSYAVFCLKKKKNKTLNSNRQTQDT